MQKFSDGKYVVTVEEKPDSRREISVFTEAVPSTPVFRWTTRYPVELIEKILQVKTAEYVCDEIRRDEDETYIRKSMDVEILGYLKPQDFSGARILDFGCGSGSSTLVLARMFPDAEITGCELVKEYVDIANERARFYGKNNLVFLQSPDGDHLPDNLGKFDYIVLSAVFEHLLPTERLKIVPLLWDFLKPNGVLLFRETPYRYSIIEAHTTGLPFLNYLPDGLAYRYATRFSKRIDRSEDWPTLLRRGIRGGTAEEILRILQPLPGNAVLLEPVQPGISNRIDLWHHLPTSSRHSTVKKLMYLAFQVIHKLTGRVVVPQVSLAIRKSAD